MAEKDKTTDQTTANDVPAPETVTEAPAAPAKEAEKETAKETAKAAKDAPPKDEKTQAAPVNTGSVFQIPKEQLDLSALKKMDIPDVRSRIQTEFESNRGYQMVADHIITVSQRHLANQQRDKVELRKKFAGLFSVLLILEYAFMVVFILLDAITAIPVDVPDSVLQLYVTSVFVQTLSTIGVMIAFAFVSKEETRIVGLLNQIIQNYQKFQIDTPPKEPKG